MKKLLITHCSTLGASETFIRAHIERLPFDTYFAHQLPPKLLDLSTYVPGDGAVVNALEDCTEEYLQIIDKISPDVVLAEYGPSGVSVLEACKQRNLPLLVHFHGFDASMSTVLERYESAYEQVFSYAARIIVVSNAMRAKLKELGAPEKKLVLNPYGVDLEKFTPAPIPDEPHLLFIGRLVPKKAPLMLLQSFAEALKSAPDLRLTLAGDGPLRRECEAFIQEKHLSDSVTLLGHIDHSEITSLLHQCCALVMPSKTAENGDQEGLPNCILEAMASGRAVIATNHAGIPDAVKDGETGILVEESDGDALSQAIIELATDSEHCQRLGKNARARAEELFSQERSINRLRDLIAQAIDS